MSLNMILAILDIILFWLVMKSTTQEMQQNSRQMIVWRTFAFILMVLITVCLGLNGKE